MTDELLEIVVSYLAQDGWPHTVVGDGTFELRYEGEHGPLTCKAVVDASHDQVRFYSLAPVEGAGHVPELLELAARINWDLRIGTVELNVDTGEVRLRTSIDVGGDRLTHALLRHVVWGNVLTMDRYGPAVAAVVGGASPADAIAAVAG